MAKQIHVFPSSSELARAACDFMADAIERACAEKGACFIALAGGNTPREVYARLAVTP